MDNFTESYQGMITEAVKFDLPFELDYADDLTKEQVKFIKEFSDMLGIKAIKKLRKLFNDFNAHNNKITLPYKSHTGKEVDKWLATNKTDNFLNTIKAVVNALSWIDPDQHTILK